MSRLNDRLNRIDRHESPRRYVVIHTTDPDWREQRAEADRTGAIVILRHTRDLAGSNS